MVLGCWKGSESKELRDPIVRQARRGALPMLTGRVLYERVGRTDGLEPNRN